MLTPCPLTFRVAGFTVTGPPEGGRVLPRPPVLAQDLACALCVSVVGTRVSASRTWHPFSSAGMLWAPPITCKRGWEGLGATALLPLCRGSVILQLRGQPCRPLCTGAAGEHASLWLAGSSLRRGLCALSRPWWPRDWPGSPNPPVHPASLWEPGPAYRGVEGAENTREKAGLPRSLSPCLALEMHSSLTGGGLAWPTILMFEVKIQTDI